MTKDEALKLALDYIVATNKSSEFWLVPASNLNNVVTAIKEALEQLEQVLNETAIRADEREVCAKFLECIDLGNLPPDLALHYGLLINSLVAGIRERGNT